MHSNYTEVYVMKKNTYAAPEAEFVCISTDADILTGSPNGEPTHGWDEYSNEYGGWIII